MPDGIEAVRFACQRLGINLGALIAEVSLWASPEVHRRLLLTNQFGCFFPGVRRARRGESRGTRDANNDLLDDNSRARRALAVSLGLSRTEISGYHACHIWPETCYDARYHTVIANLVLIPGSLASLSDHYPEIISSLKFRAYELYGWYPADASQPVEPPDYPKSWPDPLPFSERVKGAIQKGGK